MKNLILISMLLVGCSSAQMINAPGAMHSQYGPSNEATRSGMVKYANDGRLGVQSNRNEAYKQMFAACGGKYKIVTEGPRAEGSVNVGWGITQTTEVWYITFECEGPIPAAVAETPTVEDFN